LRAPAPLAWGPSFFNEWIVTGDKKTDDEIKRRIRLFAVAISNFLTLFSPQKVVFFGKGFEEGSYYFPLIKRIIRENCSWLSEEDLCLTSFNTRYSYIGAIAIAINKMLGPYSI
jgi:predicted NBD/HSP70 family sugar kinase